MWYATLAQALKELVVTNGESSDDENVYVLQALEWVTQRIDNWPSLGFEFAPRKRVRYLNAPPAPTLNSWGPSVLSSASDRADLTLALGQPLLVIEEVLDGLGDELTLWDGSRATRSAADFYLYPRGETPCWTLRLLPESAHSWSAYDTDPVEAIQVTGTWGYRSRYDEEGWKASGQTLAANLTAEADSFTLADASVFSPGQLLQIGSEWTSVRAVALAEGAGPDTVQVADRGERGTEATAHAAGTPVLIWQTEPMIIRACALWVAFLYSKRGNFAAKQVEGFTVITFPPDAPPEVAAILETFAPKSQADDTFAWGTI